MSDGITLDGKLLFPSKYIGAPDLKGRDVTLIIDHVQIESLQLVGGRKESKPVFYFRHPKTGAAIEKMFVSNKTNCRTIAKLYGKEVEGWFGKAITMYPTTTQCGRNTVDCVRIREVVPGKPAPDPAPSLNDLPGDPGEPSADEQDRILAEEAASMGVGAHA